MSIAEAADATEEEAEAVNATPGDGLPLPRSVSTTPLGCLCGTVIGDDERVGMRADEVVAAPAPICRGISEEKAFESTTSRMMSMK
jgi:hypothetical protein